MDMNLQLLTSSCCKCFVQTNINDVLYMPKLVFVYTHTYTVKIKHWHILYFTKPIIKYVGVICINSLPFLFMYLLLLQNREYTNLSITQTFLVAQVYGGRFKQKFDLLFLYLKYGKLSTLNNYMNCSLSTYGIIECVEPPHTNMGGM